MCADTQHPPQTQESPVTLDDSSLPRPPRPWGKGFLVACGTFIWPGVGQLLVGRWRTALLWSFGFAILQFLLFAFLLTAHLVIVGLVFVVLTVIWFGLALVHAFIVGRRSPGWSAPIWARYMTGCVLLGLALLLKINARVATYMDRHYFHTFVATTRGMVPALMPGDHFVLNYRLVPRRWSVVVFDQPEMGLGVPYVSRLVGLPGEQIEFRQGTLTIDGHPVTPPPNVGPYVEMSYQGLANPALRGDPCAGSEGNPVRLETDGYFLLGDNSTSSRDSRLWEIPIDGHARGVLPGAHLAPGRVTAIYWPPSRWRIFDH